MKNALRLMLVSAFALMISIPAFAQTPETSTLPVNEPLDVGGTVLQPGVYTIRVLPSLKDRNKVQITSADLQTVYATVLTVPHALQPNEEVPNTVFVYYPAGEGMPAALRTWYAPDPDASGGGHDIVYDQARAQQLARLGNSSVVSYPTATVVADLDTAPLQVVTPRATVETYTYVPPPMTSAAKPMEMPDTASNVPLIALFGLLSLGGAVAIRMTRS